MTDTTTTKTLPTTTDLAEQYATARRQRADGWLPEKQRRFLEAIAEGNTVEVACYSVGMSPASAYALRNRAAGRVFAMGWDAAARLARQRFADVLTSRALDGFEETWTRPNGETFTRRRYDNRLAMAMLSRLDRQVEARAATAEGEAARLIAQDFDAWLDLVEAGEGSARAGAFLCGRIAAEPQADPDLAAIQGLARADRWLRTGAAAAGEVDVRDLDPADRAGWTAEQWQRAEAAGLLAFAAPPETPAAEAEAEAAHVSPLYQLSDYRVWYDEAEEGWRTDFPPPPGYAGVEEGAYGEEDYVRELSPEELAVVLAREEADQAEERAGEEAARDAYFGFAIPSEPPASPPDSTAPAEGAGQAPPAGEAATLH